MTRYLLSLLALPLAAQFSLHIDLAGSWRYQAGDNAQYSDPAWDDRSWRELKVPFVRLPQPGPFWIRKIFEFPESGDSSRLVLTVGNLVSRYELFVNGTRAGEANAVTPRARLFEIPAGLIKPGRNVIAVRGSELEGVGLNRPDLVPDQGPYLLTYRENAPAYLAEFSVERRLRAGTIHVVASGLFFLLAVLALVLWMGEQSHHELLMVSGFLAADAILRLGMYLSVLFGWEVVRTYPIVHIGLVPLAYMAMYILRSRPPWLTVLIWGQAFYGTVGWFIPAVRARGLASIWQASAIVLLGFALVRVWMLSRAGQPLRVPVMAVILLLLYCQRNPTFQIFQINYSAGGFVWNTYDMAMLTSAFILIMLLLGGLSADRKEKLRLGNELEAARAVQKILLPSGAPQTSVWAVDAIYLPAQEVGGDFYQVYRLADDSCLVIIGDVSGKGLKAAMVVSVIVGALRNRHSQRPGAILEELNRSLGGCLDGGFVTASIARFTAGKAVIANAGHLSPYCDGSEVVLEGGLPLGVARDTTYPETEMVIEPGAGFVLMSDGVVEAANAGGGLFGFERAALLSAKPAKDIAAAAQAWGQNDDITVVTVRRTA